MFFLGWCSTYFDEYDSSVAKPDRRLYETYRAIQVVCNGGGEYYGAVQISFTKVYGQTSLNTRGYVKIVT